MTAGREGLRLAAPPCPHGSSLGSTACTGRCAQLHLSAPALAGRGAYCLHKGRWLHKGHWLRRIMLVVLAAARKGAPWPRASTGRWLRAILLPVRARCPCRYCWTQGLTTSREGGWPHVVMLPAVDVSVGFSPPVNFLRVSFSGLLQKKKKDANPPVNLQTRKDRRTGTVQDEKLPKKLKPEKVKEAIVATSSISKSSPVKRTIPSQSRRSRSKDKTYVSELWENWYRNFHEIPQHVVAYVSGIKLNWGSEWWKVRHVLAVCLVSQLHWVLAHINLEKRTIEIYDSLAHKTPNSPGHRLASFAGIRMLLPNILDEAECFKHSGRERRIEPFKAIRILPKKVGKQTDGDSYGIWALHFIERLSLQAINQRIRQCHIPMLRWHFACQIFSNSEPIKEDF
ncbi:hypothetical protein Dimus_025221 [Dionaea muscipula]